MQVTDTLNGVTSMDSLWLLMILSLVCPTLWWRGFRVVNVLDSITSVSIEGFKAIAHLRFWRVLIAALR